MRNLPYNYLKYNIINEFRRKYEFLEKKKGSKFYNFLIAIDIITAPILLLISSFFVTSFLIHYIKDINLYFQFISFIYIAIFTVISNYQEIMTPKDHQILFKSGLNKNKIYNILFLLSIIKNSIILINILSIGIGISLNTERPVLFLTTLIIYITIYIYISYILTLLFIKLKINGLKKILSFYYAIYNITIGTIITIVGYLLTKTVVYLVITPFLYFIKTTLQKEKKFVWTDFFYEIKNNILLLNESIKKVISIITPYNSIGILLLLILVIFIHIFLVKKNSIGKWYRHNYIQTDESLNILKKVVYKKVKDNILKIQIINLLSNVHQINFNKPYLYISYSLWFYLGVLISFASMNNTRISTAFITIMTLQLMSRDAFSFGPEFYTNALRFDSEKFSIAFYRMSNTSFSKIYNAKIKITRWLGFKEVILIYTALLVFMKFDVLLFLLTALILCFNIIVVPNLSLITSYISPHFNYQHYNELENLAEDEILEDNVYKKLKNSLTSFYVYTFLIGFAISAKYTFLMIFINVGTFIILICTIFIYKKMLRKITKKWNRRDIYLSN